MNRIRIRRLTPEDLEFAGRLRAIAGWNQTDADWRRLMALRPDGCFLLESDGRPAGTATTTGYGPDLAWIGMVLVHPDFRRRGLATALIRHGLRCLFDTGVRRVTLDATPAGEAVYGRMGFRSQWRLRRWYRDSPVDLPVPTAGGPTPGIEAAPPTDAALRAEPLPTTPEVSRTHARSTAFFSPAMLRWDRRVFGADRAALLHALAAGARAVAIEDDFGMTPEPSPTGARMGPPPRGGYAMLRDGAVASYLGPVIAGDEPTGRRLIRRVLHDSPPPDGLIWDIPEGHRAAERLAEELGLRPQRPLVRMSITATGDPDGSPSTPGPTPEQWAIGGPETG